MFYIFLWILPVILPLVAIIIFVLQGSYWLVLVFTILNFIVLFVGVYLSKKIKKMEKIKFMQKADEIKLGYERELSKIFSQTKRRENSQLDISYLDSLEKLLSHLLPVWTERIERSIAESEEGTTALTLRFKNMIRLLDEAMHSSRESVNQIIGSGDINVSLYEESKKNFKEEIKLIKREQMTVKKMIHEFSTLSQDIKDLSEMSLGIERIAEKTRLLALNAAIEASRSGEAGKGFAVVAEGVSNLSETSAKTSKDMSHKIRTLTESMAAILEYSDDANKQSLAASRSTKETLRATLKRLEQLETTTMNLQDLMQQESEQLRKEVSDVIVFMQFSDRIGQILRQILANMSQLTSHITELENDLTTNRIETFKNWLDEMLIGKDASSQFEESENQNVEEESEITFF